MQTPTPHRNAQASKIAELQAAGWRFQSWVPVADPLSSYQDALLVRHGRTQRYSVLADAAGIEHTPTTEA